MLSLTKKHRTATPRVPDCILILIHWLLSTSLQWEPNCNKHLNIRNHLGGLCDQAENSNLHGTVWIPHTKPPSRSSVIWLQQEMTELYSEWFRNTALLVLHLESYTHYSLAFCTPSPVPSHPSVCGRLLQVPIFLSFIFEWQYPETPSLLSSC